jgi:hypothetical protein
MTRVDMIHRSVKLVHKFRRIQILCADMYTQGHAAPTETPPIPRSTVVDFVQLTRDFGDLLEEIMENFKFASEIELTVKTFVTVRGYEYFHALLRRCTEFEQYWKRVYELPVLDFEGNTYLQFKHYTHLMGLYFASLLDNMKEIDRCVDTVMYMDVQRREVTDPRAHRSHVCEPLWLDIT